MNTRPVGGSENTPPVNPSIFDQIKKGASSLVNKLSATDSKITFDNYVSENQNKSGSSIDNQISKDWKKGIINKITTISKKINIAQTRPVPPNEMQSREAQSKEIINETIKSLNDQIDTHDAVIRDKQRQLFQARDDLKKLNANNEYIESSDEDEKKIFSLNDRLKLEEKISELENEIKSIRENMNTIRSKIGEFNIKLSET